MTTMPTITPEPLARIIRDGAVSPTLAQSLVETFAPLAQLADTLARDAAGINVTDATQLTEMREARKQRLALREVRCRCEAARKDTKADYLRMGKIIDAIAKHVEGLCVPEETRLQECEEFAERAEAARKEKLRSSRAPQLVELGVNPEFYRLGDMPEEDFEHLLAASRKAVKDREEAEAKRLRDEAARVEAERVEWARLTEENNRLRAEAVAREKVAKAEAEARDKEAASQRAADDEANRLASATDAEKARVYLEAVLAVPVPAFSEQDDTLFRVVSSLREWVLIKLAPLAEESGA